MYIPSVNMFSFYLGKYAEMELVGHMVNVCLLKKIPN